MIGRSNTQKDAIGEFESAMSRALSNMTVSMSHTELFALMAGNVASLTLAAGEICGALCPQIPGIDLGFMVRQKKFLERRTAATIGASMDLWRMSAFGAPIDLERWAKWERAVTGSFPIAQSPKTLVYSDGIVRVYRYDSPVPERKRVAVTLLVFAPMNKQHVFDLRQGHSFVEYMIQRGHDLFVIDWGHPTKAERHWDFNTYGLVHLPKIIARVRELTSGRNFNIFGWCLGAVISVIYAGMRPNEGLQKIMPLTAPFAFPQNKTPFTAMLKHTPTERIIAQHEGVMPAEFIDAGAESLRPWANTIGILLLLRDHLDDEEFVKDFMAMRTWLSELVPMTEALQRQLKYDLYLGDKLMQGTFETPEGLFDFGNIVADTLCLVADHDHIVLPEQTIPAIERFGSSRKRYARLPKGHIGVLTDRSAPETVWPMIDEFLRS